MTGITSIDDINFYFALKFEYWIGNISTIKLVYDTLQNAFSQFTKKCK
jgi:hypothetical protein